MKKVEALKTKKGRDKAKQFIIEGKKLVGEIPSDWTICFYVCSEAFLEEYDVSLFNDRAPCVPVSAQTFAKLTDTVTPQGILAVCEQREFFLSDMLREECFLLMGECLSDPGNIGTLVRTALAAGADGVILSEGSVEIYNPKVLRASAGAVLRIPTVTDADINEVIPLLRQQDICIYAAHPNGNALPYATDMRRSCCLLIGNEAHGLSDGICGIVDALVRLPMPGFAESLNASVAGGILMYEVVRQRLYKDS